MRPKILEADVLLRLIIMAVNLMLAYRLLDYLLTHEDKILGILLISIFLVGVEMALLHAGNITCTTYGMAFPS